jgi:hypothetical protein
MSFSVSPSLGFWILTAKPALTTQKRNERIQVKVYPSWYKQIAVEWSVPASFGPCLFNVYFSPVEDGHFEKLNTTPIDGTYLIDPTTQEYSKNTHGYYVVEAILLDRNNTTLRSDPTTWKVGQRRWVELRSIEIQRREYWLLSRFAGIKSYLFRRKTYGERCRSCWNHELEKTMDDHCPNCLGTSFEGGYFNPAPLYIQYDASPKPLVKTYFGNYEPNQIGAWTISMPDIRPDDVIVRTGDWNIYKVDRLTPTELQGNQVRQMMVLTQLSRGDVEYQLVKRNLPEFPDQYTV